MKSILLATLLLLACGCSDEPPPPRIQRGNVVKVEFHGGKFRKVTYQNGQTELRHFSDTVTVNGRETRLNNLREGYQQ